MFGTAPRELARAVTLQQTVELIRVTIAVVEDDVDELAAPGEEQLLREAVLRYSREIAFAAAQVYAQAAEARGAWDARLEALVVDALLRGEVDEPVRSRASALGWGSAARSPSSSGRARDAAPDAIADGVQRAARTPGLDVISGVHGDRLVVVLDGVGDADVARRPGASARSSRPARSWSARSCRSLDDAAELGGRGASPACAPSPPGPARPGRCSAEHLLPERALDGDPVARRRLVDDGFDPLVRGRR